MRSDHTSIVDEGTIASKEPFLETLKNLRNHGFNLTSDQPNKTGVAINDIHILYAGYSGTSRHKAAYECIIIYSED